MKILLIALLLLGLAQPLQAGSLNRYEWGKILANAEGRRQSRKELEEQREHEKNLARIYSQRGTDTVVYQPSTQSTTIKTLYTKAYIARRKCDEGDAAECDRLEILHELIEEEAE